MFNDITSRYDMTNAGLEVFIILAISFLLGFLFCYFRNRMTDSDEE